MSQEQDYVKVIDITDENFESEFPAIEKDVSESAFVAIDMEFSGLEKRKFNKAIEVDSFETRYCKIKENVETYFPLQLGLSFFKFNTSEKRYDSTIYNVYINPYSHNSLDDTISIRPGTISFLKSNHFDFNKAFLHGVSSLRRNDEKRLLDEIEQSQSVATSDKLEVNKNNLRTIKSIMTKIQDWLDVIRSGSDEKRQTLPIWNEKYYLVLDPVNSYIRRLCYQEIAATYGDLLSVVKLDEDNQHCSGNFKSLRVIYNIKNGENEADAVATNVKAVKIEEIKKIVGIRRIIDLIAGRKLPVVGFEIMNDMMFLYHWCIDRLPEKCQDFVRCLGYDFPLVVDVHSILKIESCADLLPESQALTSLYQSFALMNPPAIQGVSTEFKQAHDAGFDAYMTGDVFIKLAYQYRLDVKELQNLLDFYTTPLPLTTLHNRYERHPVQFQYAMNVINMYKMKYGMPLNLDEFKKQQEGLVEEYKKNVVLVTGFEDSVKTGDFVGLFKPYLQNNQRVQIMWLDQEYLLLAFPTIELSEKIQEDYANLHRKKSEGFGFHCFTMLPYSCYEELCGARKTTSRKREREEVQTIFETKRYRLSRITSPEPVEQKEKSGCQIMCFVFVIKHGIPQCTKSKSSFLHDGFLAGKAHESGLKSSMCWRLSRKHLVPPEPPPSPESTLWHIHPHE